MPPVSVKQGVRQKFTAGLMPFGKLCIIPGAGHLPTMAQPNAVSVIAACLNGPDYCVDASRTGPLALFGPELASMKPRTSGLMFSRQLLPAKMP